MDTHNIMLCGFLKSEKRIIEPQNLLGWEKSLRSLTLIVNSALHSPALYHFLELTHLHIFK